MQLGYKVSKCIITESRKSLKNRLYEKKNGFEVTFLQEYFEGINVIITTSP
jgi:ribosomal protein L21E